MNCSYLCNSVLFIVKATEDYEVLYSMMYSLEKFVSQDPKTRTLLVFGTGERTIVESIKNVMKLSSNEKVFFLNGLENFLQQNVQRKLEGYISPADLQALGLMLSVKTTHEKLLMLSTPEYGKLKAKITSKNSEKEMSFQDMIGFSILQDLIIELKTCVPKEQGTLLDIAVFATQNFNPKKIKSIKSAGAIGTATGAGTGAAIGGAIGVLGGPVGVIVGATVGGLIGSAGGGALGSGIQFLKKKKQQKKQKNQQKLEEHKEKIEDTSMLEEIYSKVINSATEANAILREIIDIFVSNYTKSSLSLIKCTKDVKKKHEEMKQMASDLRQRITHKNSPYKLEKQLLLRWFHSSNLWEIQHVLTASEKTKKK